MSTSLFEIVGPIMMGPSSSHTAGMARIGMMAYRIAGFSPAAITLRLSPVLSTTYRGHRTDAALVGGARGFDESSPALRSAIEDSEAAGVPVTIEFYPRGIYHPNTAQVEMKSAAGEEVHVRGISVGGGSLYIDAVDEEPLRLDPELFHLVVWGEGSGAAVRSSAFAGGRIQEGEKISAISSPSAPPEGVKASLLAVAGVQKVRLVEPVLTYGATVSEELRFTEYEDLLGYCREKEKTFAQAAVDYESSRSGFSPEEVRARMKKHLEVMRESVRLGVTEENKLLYGLLDGKDAKRMQAYYEAGKSIAGGIVALAVAKALGVMEYNASMGCVVAAPTAGSAGIVPGCLLALQEHYGFSDERMVDALCVTALTGVVMSHREVSFSGAVGGCQGECGVSSAIAAAGIASLFSDDPEVPLHAMAMCMKNLLGLVCDPIAGPVEVPCIKRNTVGVANAFASADMACAGIRSYISPDEVLEALKDVQRRLPCELRATTTGGLACTKKAVALRERLSKELVQEG